MLKLFILGAGLLWAGDASWYQAGPTDWVLHSVLTPAGPDEPPPEAFAKIRRLIWTEHKVQKGEYSAWHLAKSYNTTAMSLQTTNNDELIMLYPGKKVVVHNKEGLLYEVRKDSETLNQIVAKFHKDRRARDAFKESVVAANHLPAVALIDDWEFERGQRVLLPKITMNFDTYRFPFAGGWARVSSRFGTRMHPVTKVKKFHQGMDLPKPWGTPVYPSRSGTVVEAGWNGGYGQLIVIRHSDGYTTRYGHLSKIYVKVGQFVHRGKTMIGRVGSTGLSTGPHLHFEVRDRAGRAVNPGAKIGKR